VLVSFLPSYSLLCPTGSVLKLKFRKKKIAGKERKEENCYEVDIDHRVDSYIKSSLHEYSQLQLSLWEF